MYAINNNIIIATYLLCMSCKCISAVTTLRGIHAQKSVNRSCQQKKNVVVLSSSSSGSNTFCSLLRQQRRRHQRHSTMSSKYAFLDSDDSDSCSEGQQQQGLDLEEDIGSSSASLMSSWKKASSSSLGLIIGGSQVVEQEKKGLLTHALLSSKTVTATMMSAVVIAAVLFYTPLPSYALDLSVASISEAASVFDNLTETGFYQAFSLVFLSEIGDKTFFIAGLLAMKTSRIISYLGSMGALAAMTVLSCIIGQIFHAVPAGIAQGIPLDDVAAVVAFTFFGLKTLKEANDIDTEGGSVMEEELKDAEETVESSRTIKEVTAWGQVASTFALVFAAEFGDRSFLSTIALSAAQNPFSVCAGAVAAHGLATGVAVIGGSYVAKYISEKVIGYIGGSLFLIFALTTALGVF